MRFERYEVVAAKIKPDSIVANGTGRAMQQAAGTEMRKAHEGEQEQKKQRRNQETHTWHLSGDGMAKQLHLLQVGDIEAQSRAVNSCREESDFDYWSGNLPPETLSFFSDSENRLERQQFYKVLQECCSKDDITPYFDRLFRKSHFVFFEEGETIHRTSSTLVGAVQFVYFIIEGEVVRALEVAGEETPIGGLKSGDWLGVVELSSCGTWVCGYSCETSCILLKIPEKEFEQIIQDDAFVGLRESISQQAHEVIQQILSSLPLFLDLGRATLFEIAKQFDLVHFKRREVLFQEGDEAEEFFVIVSGAGNITKVVGDDEMLIFTSRCGEYFGELGLLKDQPQGATVRSLHGLVCVITDKKGFQRMLEIGGSVLQDRISKHVGKQMNRFIKQIDIFKGLNSHYEAISDVMIFKQVPAGVVLAKQGDSPEGFFSVVSGTVSRFLEFVETRESMVGSTAPTEGPRRIAANCEVDLPIELGELGERDTFGELSMLYRHAKSPVTYVTRTVCVMLFVPRSAFQDLLLVCPELKRRLTAAFKVASKRDQEQMARIDAVVRALRNMWGVEEEAKPEKPRDARGNAPYQLEDFSEFLAMQELL